MARRLKRTSRHERITAAEMTDALRRRFDGSYYAIARCGYREICRLVDAKTGAPVLDGNGFCCDSVRAYTWADALRKARDHFGWTAEVQQ